MSARTTVTACLLVLGIGWAGAAGAQVCKGAMALRVNDKGLTFIGQQVKALVPNKLDLPAVNATVVDWPLTESDAVVSFSWGKADLQLKDLQLSMEDGTLRVYGKADVSTGGPLVVDNPYVGLGTASCEGDVQVRDLELDLRLYLDSTGGLITANLSKAKITINNDTTVIALKGCALGSILTSVLNFLRKHFMGTIEKKIEALAKDTIRPLIESKLGGTIQLTKEVQNFVFTGRLDGVGTDQYGVSVQLGAGIHLKQPTTPACLAGLDLSAPTGCGPGTAQLASSSEAMFGAGLSEGILNHGLHAAWRSGLLCVDSADPKLQASLGPGLGQVAAKLGQPAGTKLSFALQLRKSPELRLNPGRGVELLVKELLLRLTMVPPDGKLNQTLVAADLAVGVKPWIDPTGNTVALDLTNVAINSLEIQNADGTPAALQLDPARLQRFISTVAIPALNTKLSGTVLSPAVLNVLSYQVELKSVVIGAANLAAYVNAYSLTPGSDKGAPETVLVHSPGQAVGPEVIRVLVRGSDNRTPAGLLRFKRRLDGAAWSEPAYGGRVDVTTPAGVHRLEIAAVDHDGNADPTPLMLTFKVDSVMPQLAITSRPETLLETDSASVTFAGRDDRTPDSQLQYTAQLLRVPDGGGSPQVVASKLMGPGERTAAFGALADGVYSIRIAVADAVGNVTSEDVGFVVAMTGGCSLGAAPGSSGGAPGAPLLLLALAALLWTRRCA